MKTLVGKFSNPVGYIKFYEDFSSDTSNYVLRVRVVDIDHDYTRQVEYENKNTATNTYNSVISKLTEIYEGMQTHAEKIDRILSGQ